MKQVPIYCCKPTYIPKVLTKIQFACAVPAKTKWKQVQEDHKLCVTHKASDYLTFIVNSSEAID